MGKLYLVFGKPRRLHWLLLAVSVNCSYAQTPEPLSLQQAVTQAVQRYPSVRVSQKQVAAAAAGIQLARTAYLPRVDAVAGINRATHNNVFGLLLPSQLIAPISGPALGTNSMSSVWDSTVGVLASWEPFDFGLRRANVAVAEAVRATAAAGVFRTQFELGTVAADAFLTLIAAQETVRAGQAAVDRADVLVRIVDSLVRAELRPGADYSRSQAEQAAARTQLIRAQQAVAETKALLGQFLGVAPETVAVSAGNLLQLPPDSTPTTDQLARNPVAQEQSAVIDESKARLRALERSWFPRFSLQGVTYARGSGVEVSGRGLGGVNGLGPNIQNWGLGFTVSFAAFDLPSLRAREAAQRATIEAETSRYDVVLAELTGKFNAANASLESARRVAENTPIQLSAARTALQRSTARYQAGLGNVVDVADSQRLLAQAEIDDALARLSVWRAKLAVAAARGDLTPVLQGAGR